MTKGHYNAGYDFASLALNDGKQVDSYWAYERSFGVEPTGDDAWSDFLDGTDDARHNWLVKEYGDELRDFLKDLNILLEKHKEVALSTNGCCARPSFLVGTYSAGRIEIDLPCTEQELEQQLQLRKRR